MRVIKRKAIGRMAKVIENTDKISLAKTRNKMLIAAKIADAIKAKHLTQKEVANQMKKKESEVSEWLSGTRNFQLDTLTEIEEFLGIKLIDTLSVGMPVYNSMIEFHINKNKIAVDFQNISNIWERLDNPYVSSSKVG